VASKIVKILAGEAASVRDQREVAAMLCAPMDALPPTVDEFETMKRIGVKRILARQYEGLVLYESLPLADEFHRCNAMWRIAEGSNRASKTLSAIVELLRAVTGQDPYRKYQATNGRAIVVGLKLELEIARIWRTMSQPGAFKIIRDEHTGRWRSVRYDRSDPRKLQAYDEAHRGQWRDAPPLLPPRLVKHITWEKTGVPRRVELLNGWLITFISAKADPEQGEHYHIALIEEESENPEVFKEIHRGLTRLDEPVEQRPKGIWAATAQVANPDLTELRTKAEADPESDFCRRFVFTIDDNPYVPADAKREFFDGLSDEERQTRYYGVPVSQVRRVYSAYRPQGNAIDGSGHGCEPFDVDPKLYCRYVIIDPGSTRCAVLFAAIDPNEQFLTFYDGGALAPSTPKRVGELIKAREHGMRFEAAIMDGTRGWETLDARTKTTVAKEYSEEFKAQGIAFRQYGPMCGFFPATNNLDARTQAMLRAMENRGYGPFIGTPRLRVFRGAIPALDREIYAALTDPKHPGQRQKIGTGSSKTICDLLDTAEYACGGSLAYRRPEPADKPREVNPAYEALVDKNKQRTRRDGIALWRRDRVPSATMEPL
jgi:hypothetical protein